LRASEMSFLASIRTSGDEIEIVNQLLLPHITEWLKINSIEDAHEAIRSMKASPSIDEAELFP
jgi:methylthioribose-1-phosphate isomerase